MGAWLGSHVCVTQGCPSVSAPGTHVPLACVWPNLLRCTPQRSHGRAMDPLPGRWARVLELSLPGLPNVGAVEVCWVTFNCRWTPVLSADDGTADFSFIEIILFTSAVLGVHYCGLFSLNCGRGLFSCCSTPGFSLRWLSPHRSGL